jgi:hypothetical protein
VAKGVDIEMAPLDEDHVRAKITWSEQDVGGGKLVVEVTVKNTKASPKNGNTRGGFVFINGVWKDGYESEIFAKAAIVREPAFRRMFPNLPPHPGPTHASSPEQDALQDQMKALYARARSRLPPEWDGVLEDLKR